MPDKNIFRFPANSSWADYRQEKNGMVEIKITNEAIEFLMETTGQSREDVLDWFQIALSMCDMSAQQANGADAISEGVKQETDA